MLVSGGHGDEWPEREEENQATVCPRAEEGTGHSVRCCWWSRKVRTEDCLAIRVLGADSARAVVGKQGK